MRDEVRRAVSRVSITLRFASGACMPSFSAAFHAPAYHAQETPFADSVSPTVLCVCGGSDCLRASAKRASPPGAGGTREGWYGGWLVLSE